MRGVVLDESHGTPVGVIEMSEVSRTAIQKSSLVADTETAFNPEEIGDIYENAQFRVKVSAVVSPHGVVSLSTTPVPAFKKKFVDESDDDACIDELWGGGAPILKAVKRPNNNDDESSAMLTMPPQASSSSCGPLPLHTDEQQSENKAPAKRPRSSKATAPDTESVANK
jgi:hypothetical protein